MSFLYILNKNATSIDINEDLLKVSLCPYDLDIEKYSVESQTLYFNSFSSLNNHLLKIPKGHNEEPQAAWATIEIEEKYLIIKADPLGQLPLWIYESKNIIAISCEQKALRSISEIVFNESLQADYLSIRQRRRNENDFNLIRRISPGAALKINNKKCIVEIYENKFPWDNFSANDKISTFEAQEILFAALKKSAQSVPEQNLASFLSGGIDSSVATALCPQAKLTLNLKTSLGSEEKESQETSSYLNRTSQTILFDESKILKYFSDTIYCNEIYDGLTAEIILQMLSLVEQTPKNFLNVISGYGADLLFGGMLGHKEYLQVTGVKDTSSLLDRTFWSKEMSPFYYWRSNKRLFHLYWHPDVISAALQIPLSLQQQMKNSEKFILRSLAVEKKLLSHSLAFRTKTGMTNGTQMNKIFSNTLQLPTEYSFDLKTQKSFDLFKKIFIKNLNIDSLHAF